MEHHTFRTSADPSVVTCATCGEVSVHVFHNPIKLTQKPTSPQPVVADDPVNPSHYTFTPLSHLEVADAWELGPRLWAVLKYIQRHRRKGHPLEDLRKAQWYLTSEIARMEKETPK